MGITIQVDPARSLARVTVTGEPTADEFLAARRRYLSDPAFAAAGGSWWACAAPRRAQSA